MVEGYYGVGGDRYVVGDGDFLKLDIIIYVSILFDGTLA